MPLFFDNSRPDRAKRARVKPMLKRSSIPKAKSYELLTEHELRTGGDRTLVFDVESYPNYFLVSFKCLETRRVICFEDSPVSSINRDLLGYILHRFLLVGFNSKSYDLPMVAYALDGVPAWKLKELSNEIIREEKREFSHHLLNINHIDLIDVAPLQASLKLYGGRLHCERMQDLPFEDTLELSYEQACIVKDYNVNDLDITQLLYEHLKPQIDLRIFMSEQYGTDLRSKSDAQVGETVILSELAKRGTVARKPTFEPGRAFRYAVPDSLAFQTPALQRVLETVAGATFIVGNNGEVASPPEIDAIKLTIGQCTYKLGTGGLHSTEKSISHYATESVWLIDRDVASFYPRIILNQRLFPEHLGVAFLEVYNEIVDRRLAAKAAGNKSEAECLKIAINGTFGKFGNIYSKLYMYNMVTQITVSGQLYLLMLIEAIELADIPIITANTDGIVIKCPVKRYEDLNGIVKWWEETTAFVTEETRYRSIHSRDVNNYIAIKEDGECKVKGFYSEKGSALNSVLSKNPESLIITDALQAYLAKGIPYEETIRSGKDIRRFVNVRTVKGGAYKATQYLGKAIRWYYSTSSLGETINYVISGNNVPKSTGAKPIMELPREIPSDLDYDYYVEQCLENLYDLGVKVRPHIGVLI